MPGADGEIPRKDEGLARALVEPLIGGRLICAAPPGVDFWLCRDGLRVGGLEVTVALPQAYGRLRGQLDKFGANIESAMLEATWEARLDEDRADLSKWDYEQVAMIVKAIEQRGIVDSRHLRDDLFKEELEKHGIVNLRRLEHRRNGVQCVYLLPKGWSGGVGGAAVDEVVEQRVELKRRQLARLEGERHLFVWVPHGAWAAVAALYHEPSTDPPPLADNVDNVWVAPMFGTVKSVWRRSRGQGWEVLEVGLFTRHLVGRGVEVRPARRD